MGIVDGDAEVKNHIHTSPVAQSDGHTIGVLFVDILDVLVEPTLNRSFFRLFYLDVKDS